MESIHSSHISRSITSNCIILGKWEFVLTTEGLCSMSFAGWAKVFSFKTFAAAASETPKKNVLVL